VVCKGLSATSPYENQWIDEPDMTEIFDIALLASTVRLFTPLLLAALGGMFTARAGIFNVALEGIRLLRNRGQR
jgi:ABC-type uncharacterized transport system permease subunit